MALTSNSSQKPCLTLSVASAGLLSSRTRLSISAALMRVVLRGFKYNRQEVFRSTKQFYIEEQRFYVEDTWNVRFIFNTLI